MKKLEYKKYYPYIYKDDNNELDIRLEASEMDRLKELGTCNCMGIESLEFCGGMCVTSKCKCFKILIEVLDEFEQQKFTWKDIVEIRGELHYEEFPISGLMDDENTYQIDEFLDAVGRKYNAYPDLIKTEMMDGLDHIDVESYDLGCFINGIPEEEYD